MMIDVNTRPSIPILQKFLNKKDIDVRYMLIPPYASVHIHWNEKLGELIYEIEEPLLDEYGRESLKKIKEAMMEIININVAVSQDSEEIASYIDKTARLLISELNLKISEEIYQNIFYYLHRDFVGLAECEPLLRDYYIEDIECNGINTPVYIVHRAYRNMRTNLSYNDTDKLANFVEKLAQRSGKYVSYAQPLLDGSLPDGSRVNATYTKDVSSRGPTYTIRKFTRIPWTPTKLIEMGTISPEMLAYFWILLEHKSSILIAGGTSSGKTTLLNALAFFIPPEARVVSIEDTKELMLPRENWLPSIARTPIGTGKSGEVDLFALLKSSFRQNPDYLIVGEIRGAEAFVLFQAMAAGHPSISTLHADSVDTLIRRLQTPPISLPPTLVNTLDCVAVMTHALVMKREMRKIREITEIVNVNADGSALINTPFRWDAEKNLFYFKSESKVFEKISLRKGISVEKLKQELMNRAKLLYELYRKKMFGFDEVQKVINQYYRNPEDVLRKYGVA